MKPKDIISILVIFILLCIGYYRFQNQVYSASSTQFLLDTLVEIRVKSKDKDISRQIEAAFAMIKRYEEKFSYFEPSSQLYLLNETDTWQDLDRDIADILRLAEELYYASEGKYDVSIGQLIDLWDFSTQSIPTPAEIAVALQNRGFDKVEFTGDGLVKPIDLKLNLGSIAKGFIVDKAIEYFIEQNVVEASVNAGGDIRFYSRGKRNWRIGIQHPRESDSLIEVLSIPDMAVVTSGDYERAFEVDGIRYHHILNALTGYPASPTISVTIISPRAMLADALSTAAFVMPPEEAMALIKSYPQTDGIVYFMDNYGEIVALKTEGIKVYE